MNDLYKAVSFVNSEIFVAIVTLVVGFVAIFLYIRQRRDHKSDAALLVLQEIRFAEQVIRNANSSTPPNYRLYDRLLPTNNWNNNIHLFLNDLEETELDLISRFYSRAAYIDVLIVKISDFKNSPTEVLNPGNQQIVINQPNQSGQPIQPPVVPVRLPFDLMEQTQDILVDVGGGVEFVYNTPTGEKLKRLSKKKSLLYFF